MNKISPITGAKGKITALGKSELTKLNKKLAKEADDALSFLVSVLNDAEADKKMKIDVAKFIIDSRIATSKEITKESIGRMMLEVRLNAAQGFGRHIDDVDASDSTAEVEFDKVLRVDGDEHLGDGEVVDLTNLGDLREK